MAYKVALLLLVGTLLLRQTTSAVTSSPDASSSSQCKIGTLYKASLPSGGSGVEHLKVLGDNLSADECISQCCSLGPERCQYLWVLKSTCIAVACEKSKMSSCFPQKAVSNGMQSVYVSMEHPKQVSDGMEEALEWVNQFVRGGKGGGKEGGDSPPIAAARTDEIEITLPTNEVYIYGNHSKDDKGISAYSWKLLTEHFVQPILENADQAILHVRNLIPGTYQFSLTVTDTAGQSGRTTVLVRVNKGPTSVTMGTATTKVLSRTHPATTDSPPSLGDTTTSLEDTAGSGGGGNNTASIEDHNQDMERYYTKRRNILKIVIPVLLSLAILLVLTAAIVTLCACCCERNKHRMKRYYKYKKLPETIEKT